MKNINWFVKVINKKVFELVGEKRTVINGILHRNCSGIGNTFFIMSLKEICRKNKNAVP